jgi:hypothetical protein
LVFPETKEIILEAKKQYVAFNNYVEYLDKKVTALQKRKVEAFLETHELKEKWKKEVLETAKERKRMYTLIKRNIRVDPSSSRSAEMDIEEIKELKQKLNPSLAKTELIEAKIKELQFTETRKALLHEVDVAQSMFEETAWLLMKASLYESAHSAQEQLKQQRLAEMKAKSTANCKYSPQHEDYFLPKEKDLWKSLAEEEFKRRQKKYFENLEKILEKKRKEAKKNE